jgi:anti-anti-sigma factor
MPKLPQQIRYDPDASQKHSLECGQDYDVLGLNQRRYFSKEEIEKFKEELFDYVEMSKSNICLDFSDVEFLASSALNAMILADRKLQFTRRRRLRVMNLRPEIHEVLVITRLNQMFDVYSVERSS